MAVQQKKVTDLVFKEIVNFSFSFEVTPDINESDIDDLEVEPTFFSVTWHAKSHQCMSLDIGPVRTAILLKRKNKDVLLHMSCDFMRKSYLDELINKLRDEGICNLFIVLGESYDPSTSDFKSALELIRYIREKSGNYFCIGIPGFPDCTEEKLLQMKEKTDSGADFIITQAFFELTVFRDYAIKCQKEGINVPIIPGVFLCQNYDQLNNFIDLCKVNVSSDILEKVKNSDESDSVCAEIIERMMSILCVHSSINHFHFFTLNKLKSVSSFIKRLK